MVAAFDCASAASASGAPVSVRAQAERARMIVAFTLLRSRVRVRVQVRVLWSVFGLLCSSLCRSTAEPPKPRHSQPARTGEPRTSNFERRAEPEHEPRTKHPEA